MSVCASFPLPSRFCSADAAAVAAADAAAVAAANAAADAAAGAYAQVRLVDGDEVIADSRAEGSFLAACAKFEAYVAARFRK